MRKRLCGILIAMTFLFFATAATANAASDEVLDNMMKKLQRGVINAFTGWIEFPVQVAEGFNEGFKGDENNKLFGVLFGVLDGVSHSAGRTISGVTDIIGFWAAGPENNENIGIPLDAEYAWEKGEPYDIFNPNFTDATLRPMVNKLFRGCGNGLFGFMELPYQINKGISEKAPDAGVLKGLWYWGSREISGISDVISAPFANPKDTIGITFDEKWQWEKPAKKIERME